MLELAETKSKNKGFDEGFWSKAEIKDVFLDEQREYIWNQDYWKTVVVPLFGLKKDSVILDVGCGLGFLGSSLVEFIPNGMIIGVDLDKNLIDTAKKKVEERGVSDLFDFRVGNALALPVESEIIDLSICQTLLMHLDDPAKAIREMRRVTRVGGRIVAIEPDYASYSYFDTAYESMDLSLAQRVKMWRWDRISTIGKKKLGRGDNEIGSKIPYLFFKSGLEVLDVRCSDRIFWLIPPYKGHELELKHLMLPPEEMVKHLDSKTEFLAGGGTDDEWKEYLSFLNKVWKLRKQQINEKQFTGAVFQAATITIAEKI